MKDRPILMTPENAQKCYDGRKTQTRRVIKPQPLSISWFEHQLEWCARVSENEYELRPCPYGKPGDRLWVREAHQIIEPEREIVCGVSYDLSNATAIYRGQDPDCNGRWRPSLHMPWWACRTVLEITEVRVQRLQDISVEDVIAEGGPPSTPSIDCVSREFGYPDFPRSWYAQLWESINGHGSWLVNPWVWALTFKKVEA